MVRRTILVGRLYKSVPPTKYFFKVQMVGHFIALVGVISHPVESPLQSAEGKKYSTMYRRIQSIDSFKI